MINSTRALLLVLALIICSSCGGGGSSDGWDNTGNIPLDLLQSRYQAAIADAEVAEESEIYDQLIPIAPSNNYLEWKGEGSDQRVLMSTWTSWNGYFQYLGGLMILSQEVWVDPVPEVRDACSGHGMTADNLDRRLEQYLGLPPFNGKKYFVEMWVRPEDMFRPAPDAEIDDTVAALAFPIGTTPTHRAWFTSLVGDSYVRGGYPWTRLGYTYDWGSVDSEIGATEYVVREGAIVEINAVEETINYCIQ